MSGIHPTAVVDSNARLGKGVTVGPFCVVGRDATLDDGVCLTAHVIIDGETRIGPGCTIYPFAAIGTRTQDLKYRGGRSRVVIGARTTIRETVTVNAGTADGDTTRIGDECLLMAGCHVAHNCCLGNGVIMANGCGLAGEVLVDDGAVVGGLCGVHQFVRLGRFSFCGGCSKIVKDVPPFMLVDGNPARLRGLNRVGLQRRGMPVETVAAIKKAYKILYREGLTLKQACDKIESEPEMRAEVAELIVFVRSSQRGITRPGMTKPRTGTLES